MPVVRNPVQLWRSGKLCGGLLALAFSGLTTPAAAQSASGPAQPSGATRLFNVTLNAGALYDSNVARGTEAVANARGISNYDVIYTTDAMVNAAHQLGPVNAFVQGSVGYESHEKNHSLDGGRYAVTAGVSEKLGPCGGSLYDQFSRRQSDLRDVSLAVTRNIQTDNAVGLSVQCAPIVGLTAGASGVIATSRSSAAIVPEADTNQIAVFAGYTNRVLGTLDLTGQYQKISYANKGPVAALTALPGVTIYGGGVEYKRPIGTRLQGQVGVSYSKAESDAGSAGGFSGLSANAALTYQPTKRIVAELNYARNISATLQAGSSYSINNAANLRLSYSLSPRLGVAVGGSWSHRNYRGNVNPLLLVVVSSDESRGVFGSLTSKLGRNISVGLDASYEDRTADLPIFDYHSYRVGLSASAHF